MKALEFRDVEHLHHRVSGIQSTTENAEVYELASILKALIEDQLSIAYP